MKKGRLMLAAGVMTFGTLVGLVGVNATSAKTTSYTRTAQNSFVESRYKLTAFFDADGRFIGASMNWCGSLLRS